ncbi:MAG: hypothetical protein CSA95_08955 [Bacteroidetes bacterium]|nr:MAG: hypothetical protein CSA95_08955 [Bacteroidota bacterium]PIE88130.1 MAG: hypothetical protein CSA04_03470 [Bacteroidota bacterium]
MDLYKGGALHNIKALSNVYIEPPNLRLVKAEIGEFTKVNDPLEEKRNEEVGRYRQTINNY